MLRWCFLADFSRTSSSPTLTEYAGGRSILCSVHGFTSLYFLGGVAVLLLGGLKFFYFCLCFSGGTRKFVGSVHLVCVLLLFFPGPFGGTFPARLFGLVL